MLSAHTWAQDQDNKKFSFGLQFAVDKTQMQFRLADWVFQNSSELKAIDAEAGLGFSFGTSIEYSISDKLAFRIIPLLSFQENQLVFTAENSQKMSFAIQPKSLGFPIHLVFSPRGQQKMPYFFIGPRIQHHVGDHIDPTVFSINKTELSGDFGVGVQLNFNGFDVFPQLSFTQGFSDMKAIGQSGIYNTAIRSMNRNRLSLSVIVSR